MLKKSLSKSSQTFKKAFFLELLTVQNLNFLKPFYPFKAASLRHFCSHGCQPMGYKPIDVQKLRSSDIFKIQIKNVATP